MEAMDIESADAPDPIDVPLLAHQHHLIQQANLAIGGVAIIGGAAASAPVDVPDVLNPSLVKRKWSKIQKKIFNFFFVFWRIWNNMRMLLLEWPELIECFSSQIIARRCESTRYWWLWIILNNTLIMLECIKRFISDYKRHRFLRGIFWHFFIRIKISWFFLQSKWTGRCASAANSALRSKLGRKTNERRRTKIGKTGHWS